MPELPRQETEGASGLREVRMLERIHCVRPDNPADYSLEGPIDISLPRL